MPRGTNGISVSLPWLLEEWRNREVVLAGDVLLDPVYFAHAATVLRAVGARLTINKVDFLYLQVLNDGDIPDDAGVVSIDADVQYQDEVVAANTDRLRPTLRLEDTLSSPAGVLTLAYELMDRGFISLHRFVNQYMDGICFLSTGDVEKAPDPRADRRPKVNPWYGTGSIVDDVLDDRRYWHDEHSDLFGNKWPGLFSGPAVDQFLTTQIHTRVACLKQSARTKSPYLTNNARTLHWLQKSGLGCFCGPPIEERYPVLASTLTQNCSSLSIADVVSFIENPTTHGMISDAIARNQRRMESERSAAREDWLLLVLNLFLGIFPGVGQATAVLTHLYQRSRNKRLPQ